MSKAERLRLFAAVARSELASRRERARIFETLHLTGDAGWDILLELYLARAGGVRLYVTAIGVEAGIAQTTVLRWLNVMEGEGYVQRALDSHDRRRQWIELTKSGQALMEQYLESRLKDMSCQSPHQTERCQGVSPYANDMNTSLSA